LHAFVFSVIYELTLVLCTLGNILDLIVWEFVLARSRRFVLLLIQNFINQSYSLALKEPAFHVLRPVIVELIGVRGRHLLFPPGFVLNDVFFLLLSPKRLWFMKVPFIVRDVIALYAPLVVRLSELSHA